MRGSTLSEHEIHENARAAVDSYEAETLHLGPRGVGLFIMMMMIIL